MSWLAPQVAIVDNKGYFFCMTCVSNFDFSGRPVWGDACTEENCDKCNQVVKPVDSSNYVKSYV